MLSSRVLLLFWTFLTCKDTIKKFIWFLSEKIYASKFRKRKYTHWELYFHGNMWKREIGFVLFKVKHNSKQYCCTILCFHWIVISINCSTKLKFYLCPQRKNIRKIEEKTKKKTTKFRKILILGLCIGTPSPNTPSLEGGGAFPDPLECFACIRFATLFSTDSQIIFLYYPLIELSQKCR